MAKLGDLVVGVGANTNEFNHKMREVRKQMATTMGEVKNIGKSLSIGLTAPLAIMGATSVKAFQVQAKAIAQVEAGLKSTGNQAGYTSKQLQAMASDLQGKTLFGDEVILKDATAQLLTFTNISGEQFKRTQEAALDLATRLDGDLKGASIQLGKALNDPVANLSALSRSGIQFSEEQKAVIKSLAETGRLAEAQTLILDELNKQYGGSAEAAAKADGGFTQLANAFGDLQEVIGQELMPMLTPVVEWLTSVIQKLQQVSPGVKSFAIGFAGIAAAIGPVLFAIPTLTQAFKTVKIVLAAAKFEVIKFNAAVLANPYVIAAAALATLTYGIYKWTQQTDAAGRASRRVNDAMKDAQAEAAREAVKVQVLAKQYKRAGDDLAERKRIMDEIKAISPEYFGNLDAEKTSYEDITTAIDAYNKAMIKKAMQAAMESQLQEMAAERVDILTEQNEHLRTQQELENKIAKAKADVASGDLSRARAGATIAKANADLNVQRGYIAALDEQLKEHEKEMNAFIDAMTEQTQVTESNTTATSGNTEAVTTNGTAVAKTAEELEAEREAAEAAAKARAELLQSLRDENDARKEQLAFMQELRAMQADEINAAPVVRPQFDPSGLELTGIEDIPDMARDMTEQFDDEFQVDEVAFAKWQAAQDRMAMFKDASGKMFDYMANNAANWGNSLGQAFGLMAQGAEQGKEAMKSATKGIISQSLAAAQASIIEAMINSGKFSGPAAPVVIPALVAGGIGLIQSLFADIPAFAAGGIVSGPTVGLMGEYPGAKTNPEVIAPLDKLQSMLQTSNNVTVTGRIDGNSIRLANDRTNRNAKRYLR